MALCVRIEGGLLSSDFLERIHEMPGQRPVDFGFDSRRSLVDEVSSIWSNVRKQWKEFKRIARQSSDSPTTITREHWIIPLLVLLGYKLTYQRSAVIVNGRSYLISHRAGEDEEAPPVHIVGFNQDLGERPPGRRGSLSPHALLQDYLNRTEHLWGIVTNGYLLRLLRDSSYFTRPTYIEFDLQTMMEGEHFDQFMLLFRLVHRTRLPQKVEDAPQCWLEKYHQQTVEEGERIREGLRNAVENALKTLANGFLQHQRNFALIEEIKSGSFTARDFYSELLKLIYRLLFLMVSEERNILTDNPTYLKFYSISRLRKLSEFPLDAQQRFNDLYLGLQTLFEILRKEEFASKLGLPALNGALFDPLPHLEGAFISNKDLLQAIYYLSYFVPKDENVKRRVNYAALDVEELGSVYESLLELQPALQERNGRFEFHFLEGTERKTTGSYYTPRSLVKELVESALVPVMKERLSSCETGENKEKAILSIKVCDPASGSGHFLLAAARTLARELSRIRTGEEEPSVEEYRKALRDVITHCIYGVDKNPLAVDLCKVALWIEGHNRGKPLTFLDHKIKCGDSLVGVLDLKVLKDGIPDEAFKPVGDDDRQLARVLKKRNKDERTNWVSGQLRLNFYEMAREELKKLSLEIKELIEIPEDTTGVLHQKKSEYHRLQRRAEREKIACDIWTAAFFSEIKPENISKIPTTITLRDFMERGIGAIRGDLIGHITSLARRLRFFHWPLEFPEVFEEGGFDVVLCNPPWERIKLQEKEFFATRDPDIARAPNRAARRRLIQSLPECNPELWREYQLALHDAEALSKFLRHSGRFPLTARGDINTYSVFSELFVKLLDSEGRAGVVVPTGIATDDTNKIFFEYLVQTGKLVSLFDFENREGIFPGVHRSYKFCLLTIRGDSDEREPPRFAFFLTRTNQLRDKNRVFSLTADDFKLINPNTRTCPIFRTRVDAELTRKIYERVPVLINEVTGENPWGVTFLRMFDMANDSHLFRTRKQLEEEGYKLVGNRFVPPGFSGGVQEMDDVWLPLYEAKMIWQYDHRFGSYSGVHSRSSTHLPTPSLEEYADPTFLVQPWYWVPSEEVKQRLGNWRRAWQFGFRDITNASNERTAIFGVLPRVGISGLNLIFSPQDSLSLACFAANSNSIVFDYIVRQKISGVHLNQMPLKQLVFPTPFSHRRNEIVFILPRILELIYTSWDIKPFADDVWKDADEELRRAIRRQWEGNAAETGGHTWELPEWIWAYPEIETDPRKGIPFPPFRWDEERRARLRAELDAYYAKLYDLTEKELRYILDPQDVYGPNFPGETFRVLKEKELRKYGEYRTKRLILEAWGKINCE